MGLTYFKQFFQSYYFKDVLVNTLSLSVFTMLVGFPVPIDLVADADFTVRPAVTVKEAFLRRRGSSFLFVVRVGEQIDQLVP